MAFVLDFEKPLVAIEEQINEMQTLNDQVDTTAEIKSLEEKLEKMRVEIYSKLTPWQRVQMARHPERPRSSDYIELMCEDFMELHGDRVFGDDHAIISGIGKIGGILTTIIAQQKGKDTKSQIFRNFGMTNPEGYRKALRMMKMAEKYDRPVLTLIDTPGAFPGIEAEERGQAEAIARNLFVMGRLNVPIVCVVIGEGASGGALGIGAGDKLLMMENTWYSVIAPESCSSILWRSWDFKEEAATNLRLTPDNLLDLGVIDGIIDEPLGGANRDYARAAENVKSAVLAEFDSLVKLSKEELLEQRMQKYSNMGVWIDSTKPDAKPKKK